MFHSDQINSMCSNTYIDDMYGKKTYCMCGEKPTKTFMLQTFSYSCKILSLKSKMD